MGGGSGVRQEHPTRALVPERGGVPAPCPPCLTSAPLLPGGMQPAVSGHHAMCLLRKLKYRVTSRVFASAYS